MQHNMHVYCRNCLLFNPPLSLNICQHPRAHTQGIAHVRFKRSGNHYTWRKVTTTVHNVVIGRLWLDQSGDMDIFNHKTKDNCHLKYAQYSYFSRETPRKVTGTVTDESGNAHYLLQGHWDDHLEAARVLNPEVAEQHQQTGPWKMLWEREKDVGEADDDPAGMDYGESVYKEILTVVSCD